MAKFEDLDYERQQWIVGNYYSLAILVQMLSNLSKLPLESLVEMLNSVAVEHLEQFSSEEIEKMIADFDTQHDIEIARGQN